MTVILIDSNILLRIAKPDDASHGTALKALTQLHQLKHQPVIVPQCGYEFFVVATRPIKQNGLGMEPTEATQDLDDFLFLFQLLTDESNLFETWKDLVAAYTVRGKTAHDARLVAAMKCHAVTHLLTFNLADFKRYKPEINLLDPHEVASDTFLLE